MNFIALCFPVYGSVSDKQDVYGNLSYIQR